MDGLALVAELGSPVLKHGGPARAVAVTPDGKRILTAGDVVRIWDAASGLPLGELPGTGGGFALAISPDGRRVFAGGYGARVFELGSKRSTIAIQPARQLVVAAAFTPDGGFVLGDDRIPRR